MNGSPTPILDREATVPLSAATTADRPKPRRVKTILFLVLVACGLLIALLDSSPIHLFHGKARGLVALWALVVAPLLLGFANVVIHELGHVIAGLFMGFRFVSVRVWSLRMNSGFRFRLADNRGSEYAGLARMLPIGSRAFKTRVIVMTLGGPVANLLTSFMIAPYIGTIPLAGWFMVWSGFVGIFNLVPFSRGKTLTDGRRILKLFSRKIPNKRRLALMKIVADCAKGRAPAGIDPALISAAIAIFDRSADTLVAHYIAYNAGWDTTPESEVARLLEISLQNSDLAPPALREALFADAGAFQATKRKNVALATEWLNDLPENPSTPWARLWVETAILESQEDFREALRKLDAIEGMFSQHKVSKKDLAKIQRWRSELLQKAEKHYASSPTGT